MYRKPWARRFYFQRLVPMAMLITLTACGPRSWVVLVPDADGTVGNVQVSNPAGTTHLRSAHQYTKLEDPRFVPSRPAVMKKTRLQSWFDPVLAIEPPPPVHLLLYFESGSTQLTPESAPRLPEAVTAIQARASRYVSVIGHSDTMGDEEANIVLSLRRAEAVKQMLVQAGVDASAVDISSHGESNPIVPTADNVANAENRRVEIVVR